MENIEQISKYITMLRRRQHRKIYPHFSVKIDNQWYIGVGESYSKVGRMFPCSETYSSLSQDFLGEYEIVSSGIPPELDKVIELSESVRSFRREKSVNSALVKLLEQSGIDCRGQFNWVDIMIMSYGQPQYIVELKLKIISKYQDFFQVISYMNTHSGVKLAMLLNISDGENYIFKKISRGTNIIDVITHNDIKDVLNKNFCQKCLLKPCDHNCPVYEIYRSLGNSELRMDIKWLYGKLSAVIQY